MLIICLELVGSALVALYGVAINLFADEEGLMGTHPVTSRVFGLSPQLGCHFPFDSLPVSGVAVCIYLFCRCIRFVWATSEFAFLLRHEQREIRLAYTQAAVIGYEHIHSD